jgi:soluble lytic murein transglycosylase-like protein
VLLSVAALLLGAGAARADIFYYQDADGVFHFTNTAAPGTLPFELDDQMAAATGGTGDVGGGRVSDALYDSLIREYCDRYDVEVPLVKAVIRAESSFNRMAVSRKGARGLMQLMPRTARSHGVFRLHDPRENIRGGVKHLRALLRRYRRNLSLAVAAYNAGVQPVDRYRGIPPYHETRTYVSRVLRFRRQYQREERLARN